MKLDDKTRTEPVDVEPEGAEVVTCPATGEVVGSVPMTPRAEVEAVAARLRAAQPDWQAMGAKDAPDGWAGGATGSSTIPTS